MSTLHLPPRIALLIYLADPAPRLYLSAIALFVVFFILPPALSAKLF